METIIPDLSGIDLLGLTGMDTTLRRVAATQGGEYAGPCPFCGGRDRFRVWPAHPSGRGRFWCRQCGARGDALDYVRKRDGVSFADACARLRVAVAPPRTTRADRRATSAPSAAWQARAATFVSECESALWRSEGQRALGWLRRRGLRDDTIRRARLGLNALERYESPAAWGLDASHKRVWLPRGVVIPWWIDGALWRVNIRRPAGEPKYVGPAGCRNALYNADALQAGRPAMLVEGEIDALTVQQSAGDVIAAVAAGSTCGARAALWIARLSVCSVVLVSFDCDDAGENAARWWLSVLENARRWRPYWGDANAMMQAGADVRSWTLRGLGGRTGRRLTQQEIESDPLVAFLVARWHAVATWAT